MKNMPWPLVLGLLAFASACGHDDHTVGLTLRLPSLAAQTGACDEANFGGTNTLTAVMNFSPALSSCVGLTVDPSNYTVSGGCPPIPTGVVRPLSLEYTLTNSDGVAASLLAIISYVDLRPDTLRGAGDVTVDLSAPTPPSGTMVSNPAELAALPHDREQCASIDDATPERWLCEAEWNYVYYHAQSPPDFDRDKDLISNLDEACSGTLF